MGTSLKNLSAIDTGENVGIDITGIPRTATTFMSAIGSTYRIIAPC